MLALAWFSGLWLALGAIAWLVARTIRRLESEGRNKGGL